MQTMGLIVEYNPFHNGHQWHVEAAKKQSGCQDVIAIMSGHFVQRGEPALFDKWKRAEMAIRSGVDLVIELPTVFAVRSAEFFAAGGVRLLKNLGIVSHICFGAEHADLKLLTKIATATKNPYIINDMHLGLQAGRNYAAALGKALEQHFQISPEIITSPNNILAVEYLRAIEKFAPHLIPIAVSRQKSQYKDIEITTPYASATAIRHALLKDMTITQDMRSALPEGTLNIMHALLSEKRGPVILENFSTMILAQLRTASLASIEQLPGISEGLHYKLKDCALSAGNVTEMLLRLKSKRYPYTRLQRILIHSLLRTTQAQLEAADRQGPLYARVLAFNERGRLLLKRITKKNTIPLITKTTHFLNSKQRDQSTLTPLQAMLSIDTVASDLYTLGMPSSAWNRGGWDFRYPALYLPSFSVDTSS